MGVVGVMAPLASLKNNSLGVSAVATTSYFKSNFAKVSFTSSKANLIPMQILGPTPKGKYTAGCRLISGENLSGLNSRASGPQCSGSKWSVLESTAIAKFSGIEMPLMVHGLVHLRPITLENKEQVYLTRICSRIYQAQ